MRGEIPACCCHHIVQQNIPINLCSSVKRFDTPPAAEGPHLESSWVFRAVEIIFCLWDQGQNPDILSDSKRWTANRQHKLVLTGNQRGFSRVFDRKGYLDYRVILTGLFGNKAGSESIPEGDGLPIGERIRRFLPAPDHRLHLRDVAALERLEKPHPKTDRRRRRIGWPALWSLF